VSNATLNATVTVLRQIECDSPCHIICDWPKFQPKSVLLQKLAIFALLRWSAKPMLLIHQPRWRALLLAEADALPGQVGSFREYAKGCGGVLFSAA
jgi:hypothetical protein